MEVDNVTKDPDHPPHPDAEALRDWPLYGPRNPNIANLVLQFATEQHMRLHEIETLIEKALKAQAQKSETDQSRPPHSN